MTRSLTPATCILLALSIGCVRAAQAEPAADASAPPAAPVRIFLLVGDENVLEQGVISGRTDGVHEGFHPSATPTPDEARKHVHAAVYPGAYSPTADYDSMKPVASGLVEVGDPRTRQVAPGKRGREPVPMTPFPEPAMKEGYTTVLRGYLSVDKPGRYEPLPGSGDSAFNVTEIQGREVYRRAPGQDAAAPTTVELEPGQRYAFRTVFFGKPGHDFRLPRVQIPGTLEAVAASDPAYAFLRNPDGQWSTRADVAIFDLHPIHNNTKTPARPLGIGDVAYGGGPARGVFGIERMFGQVMGERFDQPVLLVRFAAPPSTWFIAGSRSLGHDFLPPSSGGASKIEGGWDVIHFNWGVWDATYHDKSSKYFQGHETTTSVANYEKNLRALVARLKQTGATLIFANTTPVWEGEADKPNGDEDAYNAVARTIMEEQGVIYEDLHAEVRRQGRGQSRNVHDIGNLAPKVTQGILKALAERQNPGEPRPRVLLIGDSITGSYQQAVMTALDGKADVYKNPGNAESTWTGLKRIDAWLDLQQYLLSGDDYLELIDGLRDTLAHLDRFCPGYRGQGYQLAGWVWFQGLADTRSDSLTAAYQTNLANLIDDLRKDLKTPGLPVVVATLGGTGEMRVNYQKVIEAQMALGDPVQYPRFVGNLAVLDTRPFRRPDAPGGRDMFGGDARSYLDLGRASAQALLDLIDARERPQP